MSKPLVHGSYTTQNETIINNPSYRVPVKKKIRKRGFNYRLAIFCSILMFLVIPTVFQNLSDNIFFNRLNNKNIKIDDMNSFLNKVENYLYNNVSFNQRFIIGTQDNFSMEDFKQASSMPALTQRLNNLASAYPNLKPEIFVWDYQTGQYADINGSEPIPTASIIKIPVLIELFKNIEESRVSLTDTMQMTPYYRTGGSGMLQYRPDNTSFSIDFLAKKMITESDNSATNMLVSKVGGANQLNLSIKNWGIENTFMKNWLPDLKGGNYSTPRDLAKMLYNIDNPNFLSLSSRSKIVEYMSQVENNRLLKAGLPPSAQIIHKTGDIGDVLGDAGIVYLPNGRKYIVVAIVRRPWNSYSGKEFIVKASEIIYNSIASNSL